MKLNKLNHFALTSIITLGSNVIASAEDPPVEPAARGLTDEFGAEITLAYDSVYMFRGVDFGDHLVWSDVNKSFSLSETVDLSVGAWYATLAEDDYAELDLYAGIEFAVSDNVTLGLAYTYYYLTSEKDGWHEVGASLGTSVAGADLGLSYYYDFETEGSYIELGSSYEVSLSDAVALVPGVAVGFGEDYYGVSGGNHVGVSLALPIQLTSSSSLTPYIAGNIPIDSLDDLGEEDQVFGGVALTVSF